MDPCCDYIVFETSTEAESAARWEAILAQLAAHRRGIVARTTRRSGARRQLTLKLDPHAAEAIKRAVLEMKLAEDIVVFVYHRSPKPTPG